MSYCVECGVKLAESEQVCPLCNTKVINPNITAIEDIERPYPSRVEQQIKGLNRRELALMVMFFLLLPTGTTVIIDLLTGEAPFALNWSLIVVGSAFMLAVWSILPLLFSPLNVYLGICADIAAVGALLSVIAWQTDGWGWCLGLGFPILACTCLATCLMTASIRAKRLQPITRAALCCMVLGVYIVMLELAIDFYVFGYFAVRWSIYAIVPLLFIALMLFYVSRKAGLLEELKRRLFV